MGWLILAGTKVVRHDFVAGVQVRMEVPAQAARSFGLSQ